MRQVERFTFFRGGPFSQWHACHFVIDGTTYTSAEQYMMAGKARLFGDARREALILGAKHPRAQKAFGRVVTPFDEAVWRDAARAIVYCGNAAKFTQNPHLRALLMATRGTVLVEASPDDAVWGIGLAADDPRASHRAQWLGLNWLGEVLTRLREDFAAGNGPAT